MESSSSSSSCGSDAVKSIRPFNSDTESDPVWRDPEKRLSRYKFLVTSEMSALFRAGPEGQKFLIDDELEYRGSEPLVMKDHASVMPTDISWWKKKQQHFAQRLRQIEEKEKAGKLPATTMLAPAADKIYNWIPEPPKFAAEDPTLSRSSNNPLPNHTTSEHGKRKRDRYDIPEDSIRVSKKSKCDGLPDSRLRPQRREATATASQDWLSKHTQISSNTRSCHAEATRQSILISEKQPLRRSRRIMNLGDRDARSGTRPRSASSECKGQQSKKATRGRRKRNAPRKSSAGRLQNKRSFRHRGSPPLPAIDSRQDEVLAQDIASTVRRSIRLARKNPVKTTKGPVVQIPTQSVVHKT
ncbi:uncharacterized protein FMAN_14195 [Fusarium mangiferae]|uniref:Uncharacterized protein n=1 Tax=Fusarium mangiferae TaxID=192010 RepID=A0A1L7UKZ2_FUSMA|nr:uncharacterized protein FMAN_14195 [Fusarium mangiferae]CVL08141.1 uncharacterized protein FMAN_14195 [Fusarium mangiferae]